MKLAPESAVSLEWSFQWIGPEASLYGVSLTLVVSPLPIGIGLILIVLDFLQFAVFGPLCGCQSLPFALSESQWI